MKKSVVYSFLWEGGGYNTVVATDPQSAYVKALELGKPTLHRTKTLVPVKSSLRVEPTGYVPTTSDRYINMD